MYYCGVCKAIGRVFGQVPRAGLLNECAVLAMVLDTVTLQCDNMETVFKGCISNPFKKKRYLVNNTACDISAAVNVLFVYYKMKDDWQDSKKVFSAAGILALKKAYKKASKMYPDISGITQKSIKNLSALEKEQCDDVDKVSHEFANLLGEVFKISCKKLLEGYEDVFLFENMYMLGYNIGKWIYIADALCDFEDDIKTGSYNVLKLKYGNKINDEDIIFILHMCLARCCQAWENVLGSEEKHKNHKDPLAIMNNMFYLGFRNRVEKGRLNFDESV